MVALLLGLLAELQGVVLQALGFRLALPLDAQALLANLLQLGHRLLAVALMLLQQQTVALGRLLLQLLPARGELLLHLGQPALVLLLGGGGLLATLQQQLLALLAGLLAQLRNLALGLLADGGVVDQLLPLALGGGHDLVSLAAGLGDKLLPLADQFGRLGDLGRQGFPHGVHHFDGVLLVHQTAAAERNAGALQHDLLELVELIKDGDAGLSH